MVEFSMSTLIQTIFILIAIFLTRLEIESTGQILPNPTQIVGILSLSIDPKSDDSCPNSINGVFYTMSKNDTSFSDDVLSSIVFRTIPTNSKPSVSVYALTQLGNLYSMLKKLDSSQCTLLPSNVAQQLVSNRDVKAKKIESVCRFRGDDTMYSVIIPQGVSPTASHDYTLESAGIEHKSMQTSESLLGDYLRGYSGGEVYDNRESLFVISYLLDQSLSGSGYSAEQSLKSMGLRTLINAIDKIRVKLTWEYKSKTTEIVHNLESIKSRSESFLPNWELILNAPLAKSIAGKTAVAKIDKSKVAKVSKELIADF